MKDRKGRCQFVVACVGDTLEVLEAGEEALDQVAVSERGWSKLRWVGRLERDGMTACAPVAPDLRNEMIGIVVLVRDDGLSHQILGGLGWGVDDGNLTGRENHPQRNAGWARTMVESMNKCSGQHHHVSLGQRAQIHPFLRQREKPTCVSGTNPRTRLVGRTKDCLSA